jgi:hypothetical protein
MRLRPFLLYHYPTSSVRLTFLHWRCRLFSSPKCERIFTELYAMTLHKLLMSSHARGILCVNPWQLQILRITWHCWQECSGVFCDISIPVSCPVCLPDYVLCCLDSVAVVESFPPADGPPATHTLNEVRTWFLTISQLADASVCYGLISLPSAGWLSFLILLELSHLTTFMYFIMLI